LSSEFYLDLGQRLRRVRREAGLKQAAVAAEMGFRPARGQVFISLLERGKAARVTLVTVARYLKACKAPIGRFMLELAQSGAFGEPEQGLTIAVDSPSSSLKLMQEKRAKAKLRHEKQREREAQDAAIIARLWNDVQVAIRPLLPKDPTIFLSHYLEGVRTFYRAWKLATHGAWNRDPTMDVRMAFDRVEQAGLEARLVPAAVRKMREVVFDRLMEMMPHSGNT